VYACVLALADMSIPKDKTTMTLSIDTDQGEWKIIVQKPV